MKRVLLVISLATLAALPGAIRAVAQQNASDQLPAPGSISKDEGLAAWKRIEAVVTHPRCANCHVGPDNIPMWTIAGENETRPHGMNVRADKNRVNLAGAATLNCGTCHMKSTAPNDVPHAPPHVGADWKLAPVAFEWFGKTGVEICRQMRDRNRNGDRDAAGLVAHLRQEEAEKAFVPWAWERRGDRSAPPGEFKDHINDVATWGAAGQPCPAD